MIFISGGLQMSDLVEHNIIDHYVPFLPLERNHVEMCIKADLDKHNFSHKKEIIEYVHTFVKTNKTCTMKLITSLLILAKSCKL